QLVESKPCREALLAEELGNAGIASNDFRVVADNSLRQIQPFRFARSLNPVRLGARKFKTQIGPRWPLLHLPVFKRRQHLSEAGMQFYRNVLYIRVLKVGRYGPAGVCEGFWLSQ